MCYFVMDIVIGIFIGNRVEEYGEYEKSVGILFFVVKLWLVV